jgi:hypothetical protein
MPQDDAADCAARARGGECSRSPHAMFTECRLSCTACDRAAGAARVLQPLPEEALASFGRAASFRLRGAAARLPRGSKVVCGKNRDYVVSPLSNIIDERYTAYFEFDWFEAHAS